MLLLHSGLTQPPPPGDVQAIEEVNRQLAAGTFRRVAGDKVRRCREAGFVMCPCFLPC